MTVPAQEKAIVKTDIAIKVPEGCYGRIAPRSGLAAKKFIDVGGKNSIVIVVCSNRWPCNLTSFVLHLSAGVVDRDYRGNVGVVLFNFGKEPFESE